MKNDAPDMQRQQLDQWVRQAREGDQEAFRHLVEAYEKKVLALTLRMCKHKEDAAEAAQEAFLAAWQGLPFFRGEAAFSTWLYRLASNACVDLLRKEGRHRAHAGPSLDDEELPLPLPDDGPTPQEAAERREMREQVERGLRQLPEEYRQALILREIQQLSYEEISKVLEVDLGTVKSRINRGRRRLREFLTENGNLFSPPASKKHGEEGCS